MPRHGPAVLHRRSLTTAERHEGHSHDMRQPPALERPYRFTKISFLTGNR